MTIATALQRGHSSTYSLIVEGIPYVWTETALQRVDSASDPSVPSGYVSAVPALLIDDSATISVELARDTGVAGATALDLVLSWAALEDAALLGVLFATPSAESDLTADVDEIDTTINVVSSSGLTGAHVWLGRECLAVSGSTGTTLTVTRAVAGWPHLHRARSRSSYGSVTDIPSLWRGRVVQIFEHVVSPEGRLLDDTVGDDSGTYSRRIWSGTLDETPQPGPLGITLRSQALVRRLADPLGYELTMKVFAGLTDGMGAPNTRCRYPIRVHDTDTIRVTISWDDGGAGTGSRVITARGGPSSVHDPYNTTVTDWWDSVWAFIGAASTGDAWYKAASASNTGSFEVQAAWSPGIGTSRAELSQSLVYDSAYGVTFAITIQPDRCYWIGTREAQAVGVIGGFTTDLELTIGLWNGSPWVPVVQEIGEESDDDAIPSAGQAIAKSEDDAEVIRWDDTAAGGSAVDPYVMIHVIERGIGGTVRADLGHPDTEIASASGLAAGVLYSGILQLLQSSGTGDRGTYDLLPVGHGLGIDEDLIDVSSFIGDPLSRWAVLISDGQASMEDLLGGWLALYGLCVSMVWGRLTLVSTRIAIDPLSSTLTVSDVLIDRVEPQYGLRPPNVVKADPSSIGREVRPIIVRDSAAIQAEGSQVLEIKTPSIDPEEISSRAWGLIQRGRGESIIRVRSAPWVELPTGSSLTLILAHPVVYDWLNGARAPASLHALVLAEGPALYDGTRSLTLLVPGQGKSAQYLCPSSVVATVPSGSSVTVDDAQWWIDGDNVIVYTPGKEDTEQATLAIDAVTGSLITFDAPMPGWVAAGAVVSHAPWGSASTSQKAYAYVRTDTIWG